jgi:hypothetical protein
MTKKQKAWLIWLSVGTGVLILVAVPLWLAFCSSANATKLNNAFAGLQAAGSLLTVAALIAAFAQVREAKKQLMENRAWNTMSFALTSLPQMEMLRQWELELDESPVRLIQREVPLSEAEVDQIFAAANSQMHVRLKMYLNLLESYCVAINSGLAHEGVAKGIWKYKLSRHYTELLPYITRARWKAKNNGIFREIETVHLRWSAETPPPFERFGQDR